MKIMNTRKEDILKCKNIADNDYNTNDTALMK